MSDPLRPPEALTTREISKAARRLERLKLRRRTIVSKLRAVDDEIRQAGRVLRDIVRDTTAPRPGDQLTIADDDLAAGDRLVERLSEDRDAAVAANRREFESTSDCCTFHRTGGALSDACGGDDFQGREAAHA